MPNRILIIGAALLYFFPLSTALRAGCIDSVQVQVKPVQCHGLRNGVIEVTEVFGGATPFYFSLDGQSYSTRPVFDLLWAGEYQLYVRDSLGCLRVYPVLVPQPELLQVKLHLQDSSIVSGEWVDIRAQVAPTGSVITEISWRPPNLFPVQHLLNQQVRFFENTDVAIEVRNASGCVARDNLSIEVETTNLYFPNAFRPGSNQNNFFTVFAGDGVEQVEALQVFNRTGNLVFEKRNFLPNDPQLGWDGKWRGRPAPAGVYAWVAQVTFLDGRRERFSGNVTLVQD